MTAFVIQCHAGDGGHPIQSHPGAGRDPGPERERPPAFPPLDPGLRRDDLQQETRPQGRRYEEAGLPPRPREAFMRPLFVAARAKRVGRVEVDVPACRRPWRPPLRRRWPSTTTARRGRVPFFVAARAERVGRADADVPACRRPWRPPLRRRLAFHPGGASGPGPFLRSGARRARRSGGGRLAGLPIAIEGAWIRELPPNLPCPAT